MTQDTQWQVRARVLADERGAIGTARRVGQGTGGSALYSVPSCNHPGGYLVMAWPNGQVACECMAGQHEAPCYHAGAVILEREREQLAELRAQRTHAPAPRQMEPREWESHGQSLAERRESSPIARPVLAAAAPWFK